VRVPLHAQSELYDHQALPTALTGVTALPGPTTNRVAFDLDCVSSQEGRRAAVALRNVKEEQQRQI